MPERRFPAPWPVQETPACFVVIDGNGQKLAYVYFEEEHDRRSAAKMLSRDEARRSDKCGATNFIDIRQEGSAHSRNIFQTATMLGREHVGI